MTELLLAETFNVNPINLSLKDTKDFEIAVCIASGIKCQLYVYELCNDRFGLLAYTGTASEDIDQPLHLLYGIRTFAVCHFYSLGLFLPHMESKDSDQTAPMPR